MAILINPRRNGVKKSEKSERALEAMDKYLEGNVDEPMKWLVRFWKDQAAVLTYSELLNIVTEKESPKNVFNDWYKDYSKLLASKMTPLWKEAMMAAASNNPLAADLGVGFNTADYYVREWMTTRSGMMVTACLDEQKEAIRYIISEAKSNLWTPAETARYIRPVIGLTRPQAEANQRYYEAVKAKTREEHPRMSNEAVEKKARQAAGRYAAKQQRTRAETIARTEIATAYNEGNDQYVRQAMSMGLLPTMRKVWATAKDGHVCGACEDLEGVSLGMDEEFKTTVGKRIQREVSSLLPPLHPRCKCVVMYEEVKGDPGINHPQALSRIYVNKDDQLYNNLGSVKPISEYEDFGVHGVPEESKILYETNNGVETKYTAKEFANILREDPSYHSGDIRLLSCGIGANNCSFAQDLANELGVKVMAPSEDLWVSENGEMFISNNSILADMWYNGGKINADIKATGEWRIFSPNIKEG